MINKVYFGILMQFGRPFPQVFYEEIPRILQHKRSPLVYCCRLDQLPHGEALCKLPVNDLLTIYEGWKAQGRLPPDVRA